MLFGGVWSCLGAYERPAFWSRFVDNEEGDGPRLLELWEAKGAKGPTEPEAPKSSK